MAEDFNDWGSYRKQLEDEEFEQRPLIRKIFSFRSFKLAIKGFGYFLLIMVFAILFWRIITSRLPKNASKLIWTERSFAAYEELGDDLLIYTQDVGKVFDKDGKFSLYELRYIPYTNEIQFTVRYNQSTVDTLAEELTLKAMEELGENFTEADTVTVDELPEMPFAFKLRDNFGNIYTDYEYTVFTKDRYTYVRIAFSEVDVFAIKKSSPKVNFPTPEVATPDYIYKGALATEYIQSAIETIYVDSYYIGNYDGEQFAEQITLYRSGRDTTVYNYKSERPSSISAGIRSVDEILADAGKED